LIGLRPIAIPLKMQPIAAEGFPYIFLRCKAAIFMGKNFPSQGLSGIDTLQIDNRPFFFASAKMREAKQCFGTYKIQSLFDER
jgi:hypothetical protein